MAQLTKPARQRLDVAEATRRRAYRALLARRLAAGHALADAAAHGLPRSVQDRLRTRVARLDQGLSEDPQYARDLAAVQLSDRKRVHLPGEWQRATDEEMPCFRCLIRLDTIPTPR